MVERQVRGRLERGERSAVGEDDAKRSTLPSSPANAVEMLVAVVEGTRPPLGAGVVRGGRNLLGEPEAARRLPQKVDKPKWVDDAYHDDRVTSLLIDEAPAEGLSHGAGETERRVPDGSIGILTPRQVRAVVIEPGIAARPAVAPVIPAVARTVDANQARTLRENTLGGSWRKDARQGDGQRTSPSSSAARRTASMRPRRSNMPGAARSVGWRRTNQ
jgi:hypothetical protein